MLIKDGVLYAISNNDIFHGQIVVPNGVTKIAEKCFENFSNIENIVLPSSLIEIDDHAFAKCKNLVSINFPSNLKVIGKEAFLSCENLTKIDLPDSVEKIGIGCFSYNKSVSSIHLSKNLKNIPTNSFSNIKKLEELYIPKNIETISDYAFTGCFELKNIKFEEGLKSIGTSAFSHCASLKNFYLPDSVENISDSAFLGCTDITSVALPKKLKTVSSYLFSGCENLKEVTLPESIETISEGSFKNCLILKNINIPNNVKSIGEVAFYGCASIENIVLPKSLKEINADTFGNCSALNHCEIPESVTKIGNSAFAFCINLEDLVLPKKLTSLGNEVFIDCFKLKNIDISNVRSIGEQTFSNCIELESISLSKELSKIGNYAFSRCYNLKNIDLPNSVTHIGNSAFISCKKLKEIILPESLKRIGDESFSQCEGLEKIKFNDGLQSMGLKSFSETAIKELVLPNSITKIDRFAFNFCRKLEFAKLPENLQEISEGLFNNCSNLKEVVFPKTLVKIGDDSFSSTYLSRLILPESLKEIGQSAFFDIDSLQEIKIPNGIEKIDSYAFDSYPNISYIDFPNSLKVFGIQDDKYHYFDKTKDGFRLSDSNSNNSIDTFNVKLNPTFLSSNWEKKDVLLKEQQNPTICKFYNEFLSQRPKEEASNFLKSHNFTFFKQFIKKISDKDVPFDRIDYSVFNALYNLGALSMPIDVNGKKIDYAQKIVNFFEELDRKNVFDIEKIGLLFEDMQCQGVKPEFNDFLMKDFDNLFRFELFNEGFVSRCYNDFEEVQKTNTNNHGSQRQLKPTVMKFVQYFNKNKFRGITEDTKDIAETISPYFNSQEIYDRAVKIHKERISKNVPNNILSIPLKEQSPFAKIDQYASKINEIQKDTMENLVKTTKNEFSYEWLEKNDPQNFILGKLCSCCSHIDGVGVGIMHASIVDPYVQNLVIRNSKGEIIAKSTLYINPKGRYGVFNNVEVNSNINWQSKNLIYKKYIQGIRAFAEEYNKEHPNKPLNQINVGMNLNDLDMAIRANNPHSPKNLTAIDYAKYGLDGKYYSGDSDFEQYIVWKKDENKNSKENDSQFENE